MFGIVFLDELVELVFRYVLEKNKTINGKILNLKEKSTENDSLFDDVLFVVCHLHHQSLNSQLYSSLMVMMMFRRLATV